VNNTVVIAWDELPMANNATFECANEICHCIKDVDKPFRGIPFIELGDF